MTNPNLREFVAYVRNFCLTPFFAKMRSISDKNKISSIKDQHCQFKLVRKF